MRLANATFPRRRPAVTLLGAACLGASLTTAALAYVDQNAAGCAGAVRKNVMLSVVR